MDGAADEVSKLTPAMQMLWGLQERPRRGPKPGLTIERILEVAVELADRDGLAAVSMSRIAAALGFTTMSLYRYVPSKDDLLALMLDAVTADPPDMSGIGDDWRAGLERWGSLELAMYLRHPWALQVPITGPPHGPKDLAWMDAGLRVLRSTQLTLAERMDCVLLVSVHVFGQARLLNDLAAAERRDGAGGNPVDYGRLLRRLVDPTRYPALNEAVEAGVFDEEHDPQQEFTLNLDVVLDGIGVLVERRSGG